MLNASIIRKMFLKCEQTSSCKDDKFGMEKIYNKIKFSAERFEVDYKTETYEVMMMYYGENVKTAKRIGGLLKSGDAKYFIIDLHRAKPAWVSEAVHLYGDLFADYNFLALSSKTQGKEKTIERTEEKQDIINNIL